jgi:hypothetical protein
MTPSAYIATLKNTDTMEVRALVNNTAKGVFNLVMISIRLAELYLLKRRW